MYRTATTTYPCCLPTLGEFSGSWSYTTYPMQRYKKSERIKAKWKQVLHTFEFQYNLFVNQKHTYGGSGPFFTFQQNLPAYAARRGGNVYGSDL